MGENTDILHEAKKLRLLAAALDLQHFTSTSTNIVHIPGGDRVIAIGTPAQVARLVEATALTTEGIIEFGASLLGHASDTDAMDEAEAREWVSARLLEWPGCAAHDDQVDSEGGHHD